MTLASAKLRGRTINDKAAEVLLRGTEISTEGVIADALTLAEVVRATIGNKPAFEGIRRSSISNTIKESMQHARTAEVARQRIVAEKGAVKERAQKAKKAAKRREEKKLDAIVADEALGHIDVQEAIDSGSIENILTELRDVVDNMGIENKEVRESAYRRSLAHVLWAGIKNLPRVSARHVIEEKRRTIADPSTRVETAEKLAQEVVERIADLRFLTESKSIIKEMKSVFKAALAGKSSVRTALGKLKILPEHRRTIKLAKESADLSKPRYEALVQAITSFTDLSGGASDMLVEDSAIRATLTDALPSLKNREYADLSDFDLAMVAGASLGTYGSIRNRSVEEQARALEELASTFDKGKKQLLEIITQRNATIDPQKDSYFEAMRQKLPGTAVSRVKDTISSWAKEGYSMERRLSDFLVGLKEGKGKEAARSAVKWLERQWSSSSTEYRRLIAQFNTNVMGAIADAHGIVQEPVKDGPGKTARQFASDKLFAQKVSRLIDGLMTKRSEYSEVHPQSARISKQHLLQYILSWDQLDIRQDMEDNGWTEQQIASARSFLDEKDLALLDSVRALYKKRGALLDGASMATTGQRISVASDNFASVVKVGSTLWNPATVSKTSVFPPTLKARVGGGDIDADVGFLDILASRNMEQAHYIAYAEMAQVFRRFFQEKKTLTAMSQQFGKNNVGDMLSHASSIVSSHFGGKSAPWAEQLRGVYSAKVLAFNPKMVFTQPTSFWSYMWYVNPKVFVGSLFNWAHSPLESVQIAKEIIGSQQMTNRLRMGASESLANAMQRNLTGVIDETLVAMSNGRVSLPTGARTVLRTMGEFFNTTGFLQIGLADVLPAVLMGPGLVKNLKGEMLRTGYTGEVDRRAMDDFWIVTEKTQQSSTPENMSKLQREWGSFGRLLSSFKSFPTQIWSSTNDAAKKVVSGTKEERFEASKVIFVNTVILPATYQLGVSLFQMAFGRPPEDEEEETRYLKTAFEYASDPLQGWIIPGIVLETLIEGINGDQRRGGSKFIPAEGILRDVRTLGKVMAQAVETITNEDMTLEELLDDAWEETVKSVPALKAARNVTSDENN
jgi:hypothetical protein